MLVSFLNVIWNFYLVKVVLTEGFMFKIGVFAPDVLVSWLFINGEHLFFYFPIFWSK